MKDYPFEVQGLCEFEGCSIACYMTKGHHDKQKFADEVKAQYGVSIDINCVRHSYGKNTPVSGHEGTILVELKKPCKGSYSMTYIDV